MYQQTLAGATECMPSYTCWQFLCFNFAFVQYLYPCMDATPRIPHPSNPTPSAFVLRFFTLFGIETGLLDKTVKHAPFLDQFQWCVELHHLALIKNNDTVAIQNGIYAMSDRDDGAVGEQGTPQRGLEHGVGLYVDGRRGFVQHQNVGRRKHSPRQ